jgi:tRNA(fMet)-specific endonuclease VapC
MAALTARRASHQEQLLAPVARTRLAGLRMEELACISTITEAELLSGIAKVGASEQRRQSLDWFLARMRVLPWGREEAAAYGILRAKQERMGKALGPLDTQIAAHAVALGATIITSDRSFRQVAGLRIENWAADL